MKKMKLNPEQLTVTSFPTSGAAREAGTVFARQYTAFTDCSCAGTCQGHSCDTGCTWTWDGPSCYMTCQPQYTCDTCEHTCNNCR